jgi:hypothetical protein
MHSGANPHNGAEPRHICIVCRAPTQPGLTALCVVPRAPRRGAPLHCRPAVRLLGSRHRLRLGSAPLVGVRLGLSPWQA